VGFVGVLKGGGNGGNVSLQIEHVLCLDNPIKTCMKKNPKYDIKNYRKA